MREQLKDVKLSYESHNPSYARKLIAYKHDVLACATKTIVLFKTDLTQNLNWSYPFFYVIKQ